MPVVAAYKVQSVMDSQQHSSNGSNNPLLDFDFATFTGMGSGGDRPSQTGLPPLPRPPLPPSGSVDYGFDYSNAMDNVSGDIGADALMPPPPLLSTTEQTDLLGFLDRFEWEFDPILPHDMPTFPSSSPTVPVTSRGAARSGRGAAEGQGEGFRVDVTDRDAMGSEVADGRARSHGKTGDHSRHSSSDTSYSYIQARKTSSLSSPEVPTLHSSQKLPHSQSTPTISLQPASGEADSERPAKRRKSSMGDDVTSTPSNDTFSTNAPNSAASRKALLTQPQKRLNHIMSEQRRRTAIKEGFATIENLIAPDPAYTGPAPTLPPPLDKDGKPRKGVKAKSLRGKGKMGSLFRASEFLHHLQEGVGALTIEVERLEAAAKAQQDGGFRNGADGMYMGGGGSIFENALNFRTRH